MKIFRIQVPAVIMFNVQAETPEEALAIAESVRLENDSDGWDVDLTLDDEKLEDAAGRAYLDSERMKDALEPDAIVNVDEFEDEDEDEDEDEEAE